MPQVSVIMPCYNHAAFVGESIEGILAQSMSDFELIVIDDCSADDSKEVIEKYVRSDARVRAIYHQTNLGASRSRNDGIRSADGVYLAFCDADDVWMPSKLERQLELLQKFPMDEVAYCNAKIIDESGVETGERFNDKFPVPGNGCGSLFEELCTRNFVNMQTAILRRECVEDSGYFDERIKWVEDWWFWVKVSSGHSFVYTDESLAKYRVHRKSTGLVQREGYKSNRIKVFHRTLRTYPGISPQLKTQIYYHIGVAFKDLGRKRYAQRCFLRALQLQPFNLRALYRLGLSFFKDAFRRAG